MHQLLNNQTYMFVVQAIGFGAAAIGLLVYQINKRSAMLKIQLAACLIYIVHFSLLAAPTGAAMNGLVVVRNTWFSRHQRRKRKVWTLVWMDGLCFLATAATWQGARSLLPMTAWLLWTYALWQKNTRLIRRLALIASSLWFTYNFMSHSYAGMVIETINVTSDLIGIYRFDVKKHPVRKLALAYAHVRTHH